MVCPEAGKKPNETCQRPFRNENASPKAGVPLVQSSADQKQHSNIAAQQAIRSPQQSEAAKAAPPKASNTAAAASVVFIIGLLDEVELGVSSQPRDRGGGTSGSVRMPANRGTFGTGRTDILPTKAGVA